MSQTSSSELEERRPCVTPAFATKMSSRPSSRTVRSTTRGSRRPARGRPGVPRARPPSATIRSVDLLRQPGVLVVRRDDRGALGRERIGHRRPDLAARAGDHGDPSVERPAHVERLERNRPWPARFSPLARSTARRSPDSFCWSAPSARCSMRRAPRRPAGADAPRPVHGPLVAARRVRSRVPGRAPPSRGTSCGSSSCAGRSTSSLPATACSCGR